MILRFPLLRFEKSCPSLLRDFRRARPRILFSLVLLPSPHRFPVGSRSLRPCLILTPSRHRFQIPFFPLLRRSLGRTLHVFRSVFSILPPRSCRTLHLEHRKAILLE